MRALIVVGIGAVLIWFGLHRGEAAPVEANEGGAPAVEEGLALDARAPEPGRGATAADEAAAQRARRAASDRSALEKAAAQRAAAEERREMLRTQREAEARAREAAAEEASREEAARRAQAPPPAAEPELRPIESLVRPESPRGQERGLALPGGSIAPPSRAAVALLEAWISREATELESVLKGTAGVQLAPSRAQLVAGFWEAMVGRLDAAQDRFAAVSDSDDVTSEELRLLEAALGAPGVRAIPTNASARGGAGALAYAMRMVLLEDEAQALLRARHYKRAALAWSDLLQQEIDAPWPAHREALLDWARSLEQAQGNHRLSSRGEWPYLEEKVRDGDALTRVRKRVLKRRPDLLICTGLIREVNDVERYIQPGDVLRIPTDRANAVVDLDARIVLYRHGDEVVRVWPVGIGKPGHETPIGDFTVGDKLEDPTDWSKLLPPGAPGNDLGSRWLGLYRNGRKTSYGIHGTTDPSSIGGEVSLGCVRMRNEQVDELFEILPQGAEVRIQR